MNKTTICLLTLCVSLVACGNPFSLKVESLNDVSGDKIIVRTYRLPTGIFDLLGSAPTFAVNGDGSGIQAVTLPQGMSAERVYSPDGNWFLIIQGETENSPHT